MTNGPRLSGNGTARLLPERREDLRRLVASVGPTAAARTLGTGIATLERATDPYTLLSEGTVRRLNVALDLVAFSKMAGSP
jgi:hypothetical protein